MFEVDADSEESEKQVLTAVEANLGLIKMTLMPARLEMNLWPFQGFGDVIQWLFILI